MNVYELPQRIGIISGRGKLPIIISERLREINRNIKIFIAGFAGEVDKKIKNYSTEFLIVKLGELQKIVDFFNLNKVNKIFLAGVINHNRIFDSTVKLDKLSEKIFNKLQDKKANSLLCAIADELKICADSNNEGIEVLPMDFILADLIAQEGNLTNTLPTAEQLEDINFGFEIGVELSKLDIGQTIVVKDKCIVAVESLEGTDRCILRAGKLAGENTVVIKLAKYSQDMRFDLPVIGLKTISTMNKVKSKCIAIEANKTCIIDKPEVIKLANKYGICIFARTRQ